MIPFCDIPRNLPPGPPITARLPWRNRMRTAQKSCSGFHLYFSKWPSVWLIERWQAPTLQNHFALASCKWPTGFGGVSDQWRMKSCPFGHSRRAKRTALSWSTNSPSTKPSFRLARQHPRPSRKISKAYVRLIFIFLFVLTRPKYGANHGDPGHQRR